MDRIVRDHSARRKPKSVTAIFRSTSTARISFCSVGKSHLFGTFAPREIGRIVTVRNFLSTLVAATGEVLYIDGLDERRAGRGDRNTVDALVAKLFQAAPSKVRLSCRIADWLGESDLVSLKPFFDQNGGAPSVLGLTRLAEDERLDVVVAQGTTTKAATAFLEEAATRVASGNFSTVRKILSCCTRR